MGKKILSGVSVLVLFAAALASSGCEVRFQDQSSSRGLARSRTRNVILFIGDGMHLVHEIAGSRYLHGEDYSLTWHSFPCRGCAATWDVDTYNALAGAFSRPPYNEATFDPFTGYDPALGGLAPWPLDKSGLAEYLTGAATDSAAAATAMSTGHKTDGGNVSWLRGDPAGGELITIAELMRAKWGAAIGVVSTVPLTHATPAAFVSHNVNRGNYLEIGDEIIHATRPEVVIGGGHPDWTGGYVSLDQLTALRSSTEYELVERTSSVDGGSALLDRAYGLGPDKKLFGIFGGAGGNFESPAPVDAPGSPGFSVQMENPSLAEAVEAALVILSRDEDGFFLMAEQGDLDWANHNRDYARMIGCVWDLDRAVSAAMDFIDRPGDGVTRLNTLVIVTSDHGNGLMRLTDAPVLGRGDLPAQAGSSYPDGEVTYGPGSHTNELVMVYATGPGSRGFILRQGSWHSGTTLLDNSMIFDVMAAAAGIER